MFEEKPSGIQNYIAGLFTALLQKDKGHKYYFFSTGNKRLGKIASYIKADSSFLKLLRRIDTRLVNIFFDNLYVLKLIKDYKVKIFLSPSFVLPLFKPKGVKFLTVIHDLSFLKYPHNPLRIYMNLVMYMKTLMPFVIKRADCIVVDSFFVKKQLEKVYRAEPKKIQVIYPGRDNFFFPKKDEAVFL
ncbi:glycosyltransferase, partial [Patescibacteria group bacterium]|nr:glycosyltransferase [Patescibacteria group bacterium]